MLITTLFLLFLVQLFDFEKLNMLFGLELLLILESLPLDPSDFIAHGSGADG